MIPPADIAWLQRKWGLPDAAVEHVTALLAAERGGSTAVRVPGGFTGWGGAGGAPDDESPIVRVAFRGETFLQARRLFEIEREIAQRLLARTGDAAAPDGLESGLRELFGDPDDLQARAARTALSRRLAVVTGGPGTGKTYALARILALLCPHESHVRLAAPTGKAADRMKSAVADSVAGLPPAFADRHANLLQIAESSSTIHALIGFHPGTGRCRFGAANPLPCSALIVDECSMIDVTLWHALLAALPADCRLILLGDPNQLESVGQGSVFAELARLASSAESPLHPHHVHLREGRRFRERPGILAFARALEQSNADDAVAILESAKDRGARDGLAWMDLPQGGLAPEDFPPQVLAALDAVAAAEAPDAALAALSRICILTAQREFFVGARAMSESIEAWLAARGGVRNHPIIINRNDPETGLRNGAVGVIHTGGARRAWFPSATGELRSFAVARLPDFGPAWAITIHRSQGSEYDDVLVILPQEESPLATRELLYTAITRARRNVFVAGKLSAVRKAVSTPSGRTTLLALHFS